ncbi:prepilin-type N-terminal cleavage/methylation domain-containing protein [Amphritea sp. 1_MG-2023]|uniref:PilW family protein n=1 Tax=Amphritea sp. 1_MG-2023 TaxID=3062670 RepID=UPI0026E25B6D|nr:prepilin-type N-terminal cleavage/methylation domain-containing protein [Amphritea sp. 1_MG-2023]MDO6563081.1 prepilin-type N-terminal cleavage/methylation domain-containing protein [Amphritea sp. 1_MG-2023]
MLKFKRAAQQGSTLIELMISITLGLLVISSILQVYVSMVTSSAATINQTRLVEELRTASTVMTTDLRRAGYYGGVPGVDDLTNNPFVNATNDISVGQMTGEATNSCVLFSYDLDGDKTVDDGSVSVTDMEQFGYRLNASGLQMRTSGSTFSCTDTAGWETITTPEVDITSLSFALNVSCLNASTGVSGCPCTSGDPCQYIREVDISLAGRLASQTATSVSLSDSVRIRNDKYTSAAP